MMRDAWVDIGSAAVPLCLESEASSAIRMGQWRRSYGQD